MNAFSEKYKMPQTNKRTIMGNKSNKITFCFTETQTTLISFPTLKKELIQ